MSSSSANVPYVRLATLEELDKLVEIAVRAFVNDPIISYLANLKKPLDLSADVKECAEFSAFFRFLTKACFLSSGRVTVVVDPSCKCSDGSEKFHAVALWLPPNKRLAAWRVPTIVKAGVLTVLWNWGWTGFQRIVLEYQDSTHSKLEECFKTKGIQGSADNSWYLQLTFTDPDSQGKGFMSLLVREAFAYAPNAVFVLEATTPKSRDQYVHLGFEEPASVKFGQGKSDGRGIYEEGEKAVGVECWAMVKWPSSES